jgi:hypothetical protein
MAIQIKTDDGLTQDFADLQLDEAPPVILGGIKSAAARAGLIVQTKQEHYDLCQQHYRNGHDNAYEEIKGALKDYYAYDSYALKAVAEALGITIVTKYLVHFEIEGTRVLSVIVEADDEQDAEDIVSSNVSQYTDNVDVEFSYDGEGEVDTEDSYSYEIGNLMDFLSYEFIVEEYEG